MTKFVRKKASWSYFLRFLRVNSKLTSISELRLYNFFYISNSSRLAFQWSENDPKLFLIDFRLNWSKRKPVDNYIRTTIERKLKIQMPGIHKSENIHWKNKLLTARSLFFQCISFTVFSMYRIWRLTSCQSKTNPELFLNNSRPSCIVWKKNVLWSDLLRLPNDFSPWRILQKKAKNGFIYWFSISTEN